MEWLIPLLATVVSFVLFIVLIRQYLQRRKLHQLLYGISLLMFTIATFSEFYSELFGLNPFVYKAYYFSAISLVAVMASGTGFLLSKKNMLLAFLFLGYVGLLSLGLLLLIIPAEIVISELNEKTTSIGGSGMPDTIRSFSFPLSGVGGMVLIFGSLFSYFKTRYKGTLYIALGAIVMASAGRLAAMGFTSLLSLSELIGVVLLYYGVVIHPSSAKKTIANTQLQSNIVE